MWRALVSQLVETQIYPGATLSVTIARRRAGMVDGTHDSTEVMVLIVLRFGAVSESRIWLWWSRL